MRLELSEVYDLWSIKDFPMEMAGTGHFFVTFYPISFLLDVGLIPHEFIAQILRNIFTGHVNSNPPFNSSKFVGMTGNLASRGFYMRSDSDYAFCLPTSNS
ncbi:hypothetical protein B0H14DRAFT_2587822 [Mycena olivaceomarginata]|nr:hypothetical protein B0H14DRAFT_2587822 [Mycena olivaceomarginata]